MSTEYTSEMEDGSTVFPWEDEVFPFDDIPDKLTIEPGVTTLEIKEISVQYSKAKPETGKVPKKMVIVKTQVVDGPSSGMLHTIYNIFGTEDDPQAKSPDTLRKQRGAVDFRQMLIAAKVPRHPGQKDSDLFLRAVGCQFVTEILTDKNDMTKAKGFFPLGTTASQMGVKGSPARTALRSNTLRSLAPATPVVQPQATLTCPRCSESVVRSNYGEHIRAHDAVLASEDDGSPTNNQE